MAAPLSMFEPFEYKQYTVDNAADVSAWILDHPFWQPVYGREYGWLCERGLGGPSPIFLARGDVFVLRSDGFTMPVDAAPEDLPADQFVPAPIYVENDASAADEQP